MPKKNPMRLVPHRAWIPADAELFVVGEESLHREAHAALFVGFDHLDADLLAFLEVVGDLVDAFTGDLADVKETVLAREERDDGAEVEKTLHRAFVDLTDFHFGRDLLLRP